MRGDGSRGQDGRAIARQRRTAVASYFLAFLGVGVYVPYVPLYLAHVGYSGWEIGAIVGTQPLVRWTSAIVSAYVADRWRVRRQLLVVLAVAGALALVPLLVVHNRPAVAALLTAVSMCHGPLVPMLDATVIENLALLGGDYGRLRLWGSTSFILGAAASAPLVVRFTPEVVPVLLLVASVLLAAVLTRLPGDHGGGAPRLEAPWQVLTPALRAMFATVFLVELSSGAWNGFFAVHTSALGLPDSTAGVTWGLAVGAEMVVFRWGGAVLRRAALSRVVVAAIVLTAARWALAGWVVRAPAVIAVQLGHAVTFSVLHLATQALIARLVPANAATGGQALYGMARFGAGTAAGMWLAGALVDRLGTRTLFLVEAVVALTALLPALRLRRLAG